MAERTLYFRKRKAAKDKVNYEVSTMSDLTSHDVSFTTESSVTQKSYDYKRRRESDNDDIYITGSYDSRNFEMYDPKYKSDDSYSFGDYSTSVISYAEARRKLRFLTSPSKSVYEHSRKESPKRDKNKHHSPSKENEYFSPDDRGEFIRQQPQMTAHQYSSNTFSGVRYADSLLGSTFIHAEFNNRLPKVKSSKEVETHQRDSFKFNKEPLLYQINVDVVPSAEDVFGKQRPKKEPANITEEIGYKEIVDDSLRDDYPVTKDYITGNDNTLEQSKTNRIPEKNPEVKRKSRVGKSIRSPVGKHSQSGNSAPKKSIIKISSPPISNKDIFNETSTEVVRKPGSIAIANNTQQHEEIALKVSSATTRLSTLNKEMQKKPEETDRKPEITKEQSTGRKGREYTAGYPLHPITEVTQASEATNRNNMFSQRPIKPNLLRSENKAQNTRGSAMSPPLQKQIGMASKGKTSHLHSLVQGSQPSLFISGNKKPTIVEVREHPLTITTKFNKKESHLDDAESERETHSTDVRTSDITQTALSGQGVGVGKLVAQGVIEDKQEDSQEVLGQFTNTVCQIEMDSNVLETTTEKESLQQKESTEGTPRVGVKTSTVSTVQPGQTFEPGRNEEIQQLSYVKPSLGDLSCSQSSVSVNNINEREKRASAIDLHHEETENNDIGMEKEFLPAEKITSEVAYTVEDPAKYNLNPVILNESKSKKLINNFVSALVDLGRKKFQVAQKSYIEGPHDHSIVTLCFVGKNQSIRQEQKDMHSFFVQSIEPISTMYKNDQRIARSHSAKSSKHDDQSEIIEENLSVKSVQSESKIQESTVVGNKPKRGLSRLFSRSTSKLRDHESGSENGKSKLNKPWGISRQSKSKSDLEKVSPITSVRQPEQPLAIAPAAEGYDNIKEQINPIEEETNKLQQTDDKQCECFSEYVKRCRKCAFFFLGETLHQQVMNILNII